MRFEMKTDDVQALINLVRSSAERIKDLGPSFAAVLRGDCFRMVRKVKIYGQKAFLNRETYRSELKKLEEEISNA